MKNEDCAINFGIESPFRPSSIWQHSYNLPILQSSNAASYHPRRFTLDAARSRLAASDWPQFLGPSRTGVYVGAPLNEKWPSTGPRVIWRKQVGQGLSGPVVAGTQLILFHRVDDREVVESFDALTGAPKWRHAYQTSYRDDFGFDEGPRAVPVVAGGIVYTYGAEGKLSAIDLQTGKLLWNVDAMREFEVDKGFFGAAGSPLVEDGKVIANVGGRKAGIVAFDAKTGKVIWTATTDAASYSSGIAATMLGRRYAVFLTRAGLVGLDPANGQVRFQRPWRARQAASVNAATPVIVGNTIFVSAEYGPGAGALQFDGTKLVDLWASDDVLSNHYATSVFHEGTLYGFHGRQEFGPIFRAVDLQSGKVLWSTPRFGAGSVTLAGNRLVIVRESGELLIAAASPKSFQQIASAQVLPATVRAYPALSDGILYLRNDNTLVAVDLR